MFVKIGILEVHLHKGWKCHRQHSWLSLIQNTVLKADLSQAWAAWHGRHQLQAFLTSQTNGLQGLSLPAHFSRSPLHHPRTAASPWTCTRTLVSFQHHTASCWPEQQASSPQSRDTEKSPPRSLGGHLVSLSSGQVSTSAIGNLAMKVSTFWRILGVTSPVHCLGHWQSISDSLPYLLESWSLKLNKPLRLSHIL